MDKDLNKCGCGSHEEGNGCGCGSHEHEHDHECGCGCGEHEHEHFVVDLVDEEGNEVACPIIDEFEYNGGEYYLAQNPTDDSVYMFRLVEEELVVPDEDEFNEVAKYYNEVLVEN
ncbi:MAG: DUF1292 domain-containing protein [Clostridium chrysemydis]|uniref:DUF1292 domain-containing protein n=1 Tax=Clostridium TaxID=1485 RepID=UPI0021524A86|nr:DUF1292 domain-containing protein [Clostridium sp. LY3-2]MCR6513609.1 DUF1292 domain-containing protein [Clostridium sp. LY3-2]